ncbi:MAG: hypothetical protein Q4C52_01510 [Eubacteriales bacterium]|nr:hypothetical protein [Eubacteriales bacterium]
MHTYKYDPKVFFVKITVTAGFCVLIFAYAILHLVMGDMPILWGATAIVSGYFVWESFVSIANPSKVEVNDSGIIFSAYGREHRYNWEEVRRFKCKPLASGTKMFVRINEAGIFRGRYWVNCYYYSDGEELFKFLYNKEIEIDPEGLKARAVKSSQNAKNLKTRKIQKNTAKRK